MTPLFNKNKRERAAREKIALRKKRSYSEFLWSVFSRFRAECGPEKLNLSYVYLYFSSCHIYFQSLNLIRFLDF